MNMATIEEAVVYVVDDDTTHLSMMHFMLRRIGFTNVKIFSEVELAFEQMQVQPPDLIISDWNMDPIDGFQFLKMVRRNVDLTATPFIMVTANTSEHYWRDAIIAGVTEFLPKPLSVNTFRQAVMIALSISDEIPNITRMLLRHVKMQQNKHLEEAR
jgi:two-component system chemotaxis response regulator CheY